MVRIASPCPVADGLDSAAPARAEKNKPTKLQSTLRKAALGLIELLLVMTPSSPAQQCVAREAGSVAYVSSVGSDPKLSTLNKWYRALEGVGVEFIDDDAERGPGVRLRRSGKPARK